jgi:ABC-type transport system involved in multi-copper enzyme maturation permease subunit
MPLLSRWRHGPGPVFVHESIAAARRWQNYALRSLFVFGLLAALALTGLLMYLEEGGFPSTLKIQELAALGQYFYLAIATVQLVLVMLVAPAATAGAICQDRARGNLVLMMVTDLADSEIVLGKLAARLVPVLALVAATIPVLALAGLLGGIIIEAILALTLITLALAVFGCTLALAISVRATKIHEVLMAVYGIEAVWVIGPLIWELLASTGVLPAAPPWLQSLNPFVLAWAPYAWPNYLSLEWLATVLLGTFALSAGLVVFAVLRLRAGVVRDRSGSRAAGRSTWLGRLLARLSAWRPAPSLDNDPVLWREWRRSRPSRLARVIWGLFIALSLAGTVAGIVAVSKQYRTGTQFLGMVGGLQATFGLLLVSLSAPMVLAEERSRGSLDVLMATPLSSARIVLAKWWGAYRVVPALAVLPAIGALFMAAAAPEVLPGPWRSGAPPAPLTALDRFAGALLPTALLLVQGAAVTSVGLVLATWVRRSGRAVALSVTSYAFVAFAWPIGIELVPEVMTKLGWIPPGDDGTAEFCAIVFASGCPLGGQLTGFLTTLFPPSESRAALYAGQVIVFLAILLFALLVLALALATFDRCMGRMPERPRRAPRPPRGHRSTGPQGPHVPGSAGILPAPGYRAVSTRQPAGVAEPRSA